MLSIGTLAASTMSLVISAILIELWCARKDRMEGASKHERHLQIARIPKPTSVIGDIERGTGWAFAIIGSLARRWARISISAWQRVLLDSLVVGSSLWVAYLLRFEYQIPEYYGYAFLAQLPLTLVVAISTLYLMGVYRIAHPLMDMHALALLARACLIYSFPLFLLRFFAPAPLQALRIPLSVIILHSVLGFGGLAALRVGTRAAHERFQRNRPRRLLLIGADWPALVLLRELDRQKLSAFEVLGLVDDDPRKEGLSFQGVGVLGTLEDLPRLFSWFKPDEAVLTTDRLAGPKIREIVALCDRLGMKLLRVLDLDDFLWAKGFDVLLRELAKDETDDLSHQTTAM